MDNPETSIEDHQADKLRRTGVRCQITGAAIIIGTLIATLIAAILTGDLVWVDSKGQYFFTLADCIAGLTGATLVIIGVGKVNVALVQAEMATVTDRLAAIEEHVAQVDQALAKIAEHLPEVINVANWQGYNDAIREGFTSHCTGTDGSQTGPPRLGLVPPKPNNN